jgi:hypothetical protein
MTVVSFGGLNRITLIGIMYLVTTLPSLAAWLVLAKKPFIRQVSYQDNA